MEERLQRRWLVPASARRACEEIIRQGRVKIDGQIATLGRRSISLPAS
jgi:16S rRNA U516 pseudouridylate synthase RsuA-like enzyme